LTDTKEHKGACTRKVSHKLSAASRGHHFIKVLFQEFAIDRCNLSLTTEDI